MKAPPTRCCQSGHTILVAEEAANAAERTLADMEAEEEARLCAKDERNATVDHELEADENSDWLRGRGWPVWFHQKPLPILLTAATLPAKGCPRDLFLGRWNGLDCVSPVTTENALQLLSVASYQVLSRYQESLTCTPRVLRCWVRSWTQSFFPYRLSELSGGRGKRLDRIEWPCLYRPWKCVAYQRHRATSQVI